MNDHSQISVISRDPRTTFDLGKTIGQNILPGTIIALTGDLGAGKTAFVKGLARGLGVPDKYAITSPTYTLINEYPGKYPFFHVDLYRLENTVDFEDIGLYDMLDEYSVAAIEWADRLDSEILSNALRIHIGFAGETERRFDIAGIPPELAVIIRKINNLTPNTINFAFCTLNFALFFKENQWL